MNSRFTIAIVMTMLVLVFTRAAVAQSAYQFRYAFGTYCG